MRAGEPATAFRAFLLAYLMTCGGMGERWDFRNGGRRCKSALMGRHADTAPANDRLMSGVVGVLLVLLAAVCLLAAF